MSSLLIAQDLAQDTLETCGIDPGVICQWVLDQTGSELLASAAGNLLPDVLRVGGIVLVAWLLSRFARRLAVRTVTAAVAEGRDALRALRRRATPEGGETTLSAGELDAAEVRAERAAQRASTLGGVVGSVLAFAIWTVAVTMILSDFGVNVGPLIAGAGIVGVALGFGAQSLVKDFLSGTFMLIEDQYGIGDVVDVGDATGTVEAVSLRVTRLRDVEGTVWHVPNGEIRRVGNMSQLWSRSLLDIGVAYDTDLDHASQVINDVAHEMAVDPAWEPHILEDPDLWGVQQFGADEVVLRLVIKTRPAVQWKVNREFRRRIKDAFDAEGIEIPFPQRTIWIRADGQPAGVPDAVLQPPAGSDGAGAPDDAPVPPPPGA